MHESCYNSNFTHINYVTMQRTANSLIAFNERVTFWLQRVRSLPCVCAYVTLFARRLAYNHYAIAHAYNAANTHAQGSDRSRWSQKVTLSSKAIGSIETLEIIVLFCVYWHWSDMVYSMSDSTKRHFYAKYSHLKHTPWWKYVVTTFEDLLGEACSSLYMALMLVLILM